MLPPDVRFLASAHRARQQQLVALVVIRIRQLWRNVDPAALAASWDSRAAAAALSLTTAAQLEAARGAGDYVGAVVRAWGGTPEPAGAVPVRPFAGLASDGRRLDTLLRQPVSHVEALVRGGAPTADALGVGTRRLDRIVATQVADSARSSTGVAIVADRQVSGYVRQLSLPSCGQCLVLAGRVYPSSAGFARHPRCDCTAVPVTAQAQAQSPRELFTAMSDEQLRQCGWSAPDVRAARDGADIAQVVNAHRGLSSMTVAGRQVPTTHEGTTRRGLAGQRLGARRGERVVRLTPEAIYAEAQRLGWPRDETIRQLTRHGYII